MLQVFISFIMSSSYASSDNMSGGNSKIQDVGIIHENHDHSNKVYQEMFNVGMDISKEVKKVMISLWATPEVKAIIGGCACFWGGVFILGVVYIAVVYIKRNFEPEDVKKGVKRYLS